MQEILAAGPNASGERLLLQLCHHRAWLESKLPRPCVARPGCAARGGARPVPGLDCATDAHRSKVVAGTPWRIPRTHRNSDWHRRSQCRATRIRFISSSTAVLGPKACIGEFFLRILVQHLQVGVRRLASTVVVQLLDIFAMVSFAVGQAEKPLFEDRIAAVPTPAG